jgi:hypothetical protein
MPGNSICMKCKKIGCKSINVVSDGFCLRHHHQFQKGLIDLKGQTVRLKRKTYCTFDGCVKQEYRDGYCKAHLESKLKGLRKQEPILRFPSLEYLMEHVSRCSPYGRPPRNWAKRSKGEKTALLKRACNVFNLMGILRTDTDPDILSICEDKLRKHELQILRSDMQACRIEGCDRGSPNSKGLCEVHADLYQRGVIDFNGKKLRGTRQKKYDSCKIEGCTGPGNPGFVHGFCKNHYALYRRGKIDYFGFPVKDSTRAAKVKIGEFNGLMTLINRAKIKAETLVEGLHELVGQEEFIKRVTLVLDALQALYTPNFIIKSMPFLNNNSLKILLGGERSATIPISLETQNGLEKRLFQGVLYRGQSSSMAVLRYEQKDGINEPVRGILMLKDISDGSVFPFVCKAIDANGSVIHQIRVDQLDIKLSLGDDTLIFL